MSEDKFSATDSKSETGNATRQEAQRGGLEGVGRQPATRTVGVYERPAQRMKMSLPLIVILILAVLVSVVATARFLF